VGVILWREKWCRSEFWGGGAHSVSMGDNNLKVVVLVRLGIWGFAGNGVIRRGFRVLG